MAASIRVATEDALSDRNLATKRGDLCELQHVPRKDCSLVFVAAARSRFLPRTCSLELCPTKRNNTRIVAHQRGVCLNLPPSRDSAETVPGRSPGSTPAMVPAAVPARAIGVSPISTAFYRCAPLTRLTAAPQTVTIDASLNGLGEGWASLTRTGCFIPTPDAPLDSGDLAGVPF